MPSDLETPLTPEASARLRRPAVLRPVKTAALIFAGKGAREGYLAGLDQAVISAANFLATVLLARQISPTELGVYGVGFTTLRLIRSIQDGITIQPLNTFGAAMGIEDFKRYATNTAAIQVIFALVSAACAALGGLILIRTGNDTAGPALFSLWFAFLFTQLQEYIRRMLYTRSQVFNAVINTILANAARLVLLLIWADQGELNGIAGLNAIAWGSLIALGPGLWQTRSFWTFRFSNLMGTWKMNWFFGRWILGGSLANWVSVEFYPILTAGMISFAAAGAYRALQNLVAPVHTLLRATDTFFTPRASRIFDEKGLPALSRTLGLIYLASGIPLLAVLAIGILFPAPLLHLLYGDTYLEYSGGMLLMSIFYTLWFAYWPLQTALKAARFSRPIFAANLAAMATMFTVGVWMIHRWGVYGTIAGQALNALIVAIVLWIAWLVLQRKT